MKPRTDHRPFAPQKPPATHNGIPFGSVYCGPLMKRHATMGHLADISPALPADVCVTGRASQRRSLPIAEMPPRASGDGGPSKPAANVRGGERFW